MSEEATVRILRFRGSSRRTVPYEKEVAIKIIFASIVSGGGSSSRKLARRYV
jgi:hypothetical protein